MTRPPTNLRASLACSKRSAREATRACRASGEILVTNVVRELAEGRKYLFSERGAADLKGFDEAVRLFEVRWKS